MQQFANGLLEAFGGWGGEVILSAKVKELGLEKEGKRVEKVTLQDGRSFLSEFFVSACDAKQTFVDFFAREKKNVACDERIKLIDESTSGLIVYLGMRSEFKYNSLLNSNVYVINTESFEETCFRYRGEMNDHFVITSPKKLQKQTDLGGLSICLTTNADYQGNEQGEKKRAMIDRLIDLGGRVIPGLKENIKLRNSATPQTLNEWTLNFKGAAFGEMCSPVSFLHPDLSQKTCFQNLFVVGQWTNLGGGIPMVALSALNASNFIKNQKSI